MNLADYSETTIGSMSFGVGGMLTPRIPNIADDNFI